MTGLIALCKYDKILFLELSNIPEVAYAIASGLIFSPWLYFPRALSWNIKNSFWDLISLAPVLGSSSSSFGEIVLKRIIDGKF